MKVTESNGRLLLRGSPGLLWLLGVFFLPVGILVLMALAGLFSDPNDITTRDRAIVFALGLSAVGVGVYVLHCSPLRITILDRASGLLILRRRGAFGVSTLNHPLAEVVLVRLVECPGGDGKATFQLQFVLKDATYVAPSPLWAAGRHEDQGSRVAAWLGVAFRHDIVSERERPFKKTA